MSTTFQEHESSERCRRFLRDTRCLAWSTERVALTRRRSRPGLASKARRKDGSTFGVQVNVFRFVHSVIACRQSVRNFGWQDALVKGTVLISRAPNDAC